MAQAFISLMIFEMENHKNFKPGAAFSINERSGIYEPDQLLGSNEWNGSSVGVLPDRKLLYGSNNGSTQCRGFSWLVYQACWGSYSYGTTRLTGVTATNATVLYNYAAMYGKGSRFNFNSPTYHSMIITQTFSTTVGGTLTYYIDVYHANWGNDNKVCVTRFTKEQFYSYFQVFQNVQDPS